MEAVLFGDGPAHSTAWRGPGWGEGDSRLTDSPVRQQHPLSLGPCLRSEPTCVQTTRRWKTPGREEILDGARRIPLRLRNSKRSWSYVRIPLPLPHFRPLARLLQSSAILSTPFTPPQIFKHSDRSSELLNPLQCRCHSNSCELARWIGSGCIWTHSSSHTSSLSASERGGALECPLMTAVLWFLMEDLPLFIQDSFCFKSSTRTFFLPRHLSDHISSRFDSSYMFSLAPHYKYIIHTFSSAGAATGYKRDRALL